MELLKFIGITLAFLFIFWRIYHYFWIRSFRARINDYRESIVYDRDLEDTWLKVVLKTIKGDQVSFVKCTITHVYPDGKVSAVFKNPFKSFSRSTSITASIKDIYPHWAVPNRHKNKPWTQFFFNQK